MTKNYSRLEAEFAGILQQLDLDFEQQVKFKECHYKKSLPFDFMVKFNNGSSLLVEVDGKQHYEHIPYFHKTVEDFKLQQKRDSIKDQFVVDYEMDFLRIRYDDMRVVFENKLKELKEFNAIVEV